MALTKEVVIDQITVDAIGTVFVREATIVNEDGVELSRSYHRNSFPPGSDVTAQDANVQAICGAAWTPEIVAAWQEKIAAEQGA